MPLPIQPKRAGVLNFHGEDIPIRSLTARELSGLQGVTDADDINVHLIAYSFDMTIEDALAWYDSADAGDMTAVMEAISTVSGLGQAANKSRAASDAVLDARPGV